jgi:hypothetical protein
MKTQITDEMVSRFLNWKLPTDFCPDCGITFKRESDYDHPEFGRTKYEPTGTNLLDAKQAREMLEHVAQGAAESKVLTEHSGCGNGTQVDQLTVRLNPGDKVVLVMGPYSAAIAKSQAPD